MRLKIDWEHQLSDNSPVYMQVSMGNVVLHLTEHHVDCSPGAKALINFEGLQRFHKRLLETNYKYNKPRLETSAWGAMVMEVIDTFNNRLLFNEKQAVVA
ncbi:glyoxalase superfamily protein [Pontibacter silvestris]|uniref:Glyoxalase superfamily protein n=1 Tax=Pontibacter silvestris TaxID=2305183 RepID=A0ABW4X2B2_9BACT|nr:glyoxalase superfamily protein [Pontibacter silvestris]MCC9134877.1 VOC family protein [Pontibacter silvestris]